LIDLENREQRSESLDLIFKKHFKTKQKKEVIFNIQMIQFKYSLCLFSLLILNSCVTKNSKEKSTEIDKKISIENEIIIDYHSKELLTIEIFEKLKEKDSMIQCYSGDYYRIDIGNLFSNGSTYALLAYFTSDTTCKILIDKKTNQKWENVFSQEMEIWQHLNDFEYLRFQDFTGDNKNEILIPQSISPSHGNHNYYCLKNENDNIKSIPNFENLTAPEFEYVTKKIHTLSRAGIGNYIASEFYLIKNNLIRINEVNSSTAPFINSKEEYVQIIEYYKIKNDKRILFLIDSIPGLNNELPAFWETYFDRLKEQEHK